MNVFVLNTGRCGSTTFIKACQHISNYSSAHESRIKLIGDNHFNYPENHIEVDNRLSWFLGKLDSHYGNDAFYVHLFRDQNDTAKSFTKRYDIGIIKAYRTEISINLQEKYSPMDVSLDYCETVNSNIELFLKDKTKKMIINLENAKQDFQLLWELIGAEGNIELALLEFDKAYNASTPNSNIPKKKGLRIRILHKLKRVIIKFPSFLRAA